MSYWTRNEQHGNNKNHQELQFDWRVLYVSASCHHDTA